MRCAVRATLPRSSCRELFLRRTFTCARGGCPCCRPKTWPACRLPVVGVAGRVALAPGDLDALARPVSSSDEFLPEDGVPHRVPVAGLPMTPWPLESGLLEPARHVLGVGVDDDLALPVSCNWITQPSSSKPRGPPKTLLRHSVQRLRSRVPRRVGSFGCWSTCLHRMASVTLLKQRT